jgi:hypothetical protein
MYHSGPIAVYQLLVYQWILLLWANVSFMKWGTLFNSSLLMYDIFRGSTML